MTARQAKKVLRRAWSWAYYRGPVGGRPLAFLGFWLTFYGWGFDVRLPRRFLTWVYGRCVYISSDATEDTAVWKHRFRGGKL